jgi:hypothetical protein
MKKSYLLLANMRYLLLGIIVLGSLIGCNAPTEKDNVSIKTRNMVAHC